MPCLGSLLTGAGAERIKATTGRRLRGSGLWPGTCSLTLRTTSGHQRLWRRQAAALRLSTSTAPRRRSQNNVFRTGLTRLGGSERAFHAGHRHPWRAWSSLSLRGFAFVCGVGVLRAHGPQHPVIPDACTRLGSGGASEGQGGLRSWALWGLPQLLGWGRGPHRCPQCGRSQGRGHPPPAVITTQSVSAPDTLTLGPCWPGWGVPSEVGPSPPLASAPLLSTPTSTASCTSPHPGHTGHPRAGVRRPGQPLCRAQRASPTASIC